MCLEINLQYALLFIGAFCVENILSKSITWMEVELIGYQNAEGGLFRSDVKVKRHNKTTFGMSGKAELLEDFSNDWEFEGVLYHSAYGNNQYVKTPYKIPKTPLCNNIDGMFKDTGAAKLLADASDLPQPKPNESLCKDYKKGNYTVRQFLVTKDIVPKILPIGYYKAQAIYKRANLTTITQMHVRLY